MAWPFPTRSSGDRPAAARTEPRNPTLRDIAENAARHKARINEIGAWSVMNANLQAHQLAAQAAGLDPQRSVIPWGSTNVVANYSQDSPAGGLVAKAVLAGVAALGLGAGGLGVASLAGAIGGTPPSPQPAAAAPQYEWILEVERNDELSTHRRSADGSASGGSRSRPKP